MAKKINLEFSNLDNKCLENDLLDVDDWFEKAKDGKINKCKKRLMKEWYPKLMKDKNVDTIPANEEDLLNLIFSRPDYKNRVDREEENEI